MVESFLSTLTAQYPDLLAVLLTDSDGVIVAKAVDPNVSASLLQPAFTASFLLGSEQVSKLGMGPAKSIVCNFPVYSILQFHYRPLLLCLICKAGTDLSVMQALGVALEENVNRIAKMIK